jgi:hypothetical protein
MDSVMRGRTLFEPHASPQLIFSKEEMIKRAERVQENQRDEGLGQEAMRNPGRKI